MWHFGWKKDANSTYDVSKKPKKAEHRCSRRKANDKSKKLLNVPAGRKLQQSVYEVHELNESMTLEITGTGPLA
ncbi:hypothetical protein AKJ16_DCAP03304 [Drosera capensis]